MVASRFLASLRQRPSQAKVLSTIQRGGKRDKADRIGDIAHDFHTNGLNRLRHAIMVIADIGMRLCDEWIKATDDSIT